MLSMKAVEVIEKRYLDTGVIEHNEIMELVRTVRVKDQQLAGAVRTIANLGRCPVDERTVN